MWLKGNNSRKGRRDIFPFISHLAGGKVSPFLKAVINWPITARVFESRITGKCVVLSLGGISLPRHDLGCQLRKTIY